MGEIEERSTYNVRAVSCPADILEYVCQACCHYRSIICLCVRSSSIKFKPFSYQNHLKVLHLKFKWEGGIVLDHWRFVGQLDSLRELSLLNFKTISLYELNFITGIQTLKSLALGKLSCIFDNDMTSLSNLADLEDLHLETYTEEYMFADTVLRALLLMRKIKSVKLIGFEIGPDYERLSRLVPNCVLERPIPSFINGFEVRDSGQPLNEKPEFKLS